MQATSTTFVDYVLRGGRRRICLSPPNVSDLRWLNCPKVLDE
jgi:hypothetical protein